MYGQRGYVVKGQEHAKGSAKGDLKEFFHIGNPAILNPKNIWPIEVDNFEEIGTNAFLTLKNIGLTLLKAIAIYLHLEEDYFTSKVKGGESIMRSIHYYPLTAEDIEDGAFRAAAHGDINLIVEDFPFNQFDYCLLTQTIQAVQEPDQLLNTLKKVSKNIIVSFNNSARLSKISNFLLTGSFDSLLKKANSDHWYNTDYIHPCSIKDFKKLATDLDLKIISTFDVLSQKKFENGKIPSNLFCKEVLFHITNEQ